MSTEDLQNYGLPESPYWNLVSSGLRKPNATGRCKACKACKNSPKTGCSKRDRPQCFGCRNSATCWGLLPCETWDEDERARYYAKFFCQAYENPDPDHRVEFIIQSLYRLDLDTKRIIKIRYHSKITAT